MSPHVHFKDEGFEDMQISPSTLPSAIANWPEDQRAGASSLSGGASRWVGTALPADSLIFPPSLNTEFAFQLLLTVTTSTLASLTSRLTPLLQRDFISHLPSELAVHILSFTDPKTVGRAARVSRKWAELATDNTIWRSMFRARGWTVNEAFLDRWAREGNGGGDGGGKSLSLGRRRRRSSAAHSRHHAEVAAFADTAGAAPGAEGHHRHHPAYDGAHIDAGYAEMDDDDYDDSTSDAFSDYSDASDSPLDPSAIYSSSYLSSSSEIWQLARETLDDDPGEAAATPVVRSLPLPPALKISHDPERHADLDW
ncbi:hypothetical protein BDK51DRAFT_40315, partial [Blyttiomyces helicus]